MLVFTCAAERLHTMLQCPPVCRLESVGENPGHGAPPLLLYTAGHHRRQCWRQGGNTPLLPLLLPAHTVDQTVDEAVDVEASEVLPGDGDTSSGQSEAEVESLAGTVVLEQEPGEHVQVAGEHVHVARTVLGDLRQAGHTHTAAHHRLTSQP